MAIRPVYDDDQARVAPALGFLPNGERHRRGYRAHCPTCGYLSNVVDYRTAGRYVTLHRRGCP